MAVYRFGSELLPERRELFRYRSRRGRRLARIAKRRCSIWIVFFIAILFMIYLFRGLYHGHLNREPFTEEDVESVWNSSQVNIVQNEDIFSDDQVSYIASEKESYPTSPALQNSRMYSFDANGSNNILRSGTVGADSVLTDVLHNRSGLEVPKSPRSNHHKKYVPCEVGFAEAVDDLVEPKVPMNFTQISLKYINKEEKPYGPDIFEPRFGGHQTLEERENSFYARNQTLHCGFVKVPKGSPSTGFDLYEQDKNFMATCRIVVSSCIFGSSDFLRRPTSSKISEYSKKNVCFVMFLDDLTLEKLSEEGQVSDDRGYIGLWRVVIVRNLPYPDMRKTGKVPKFLSHRLFPSARYSIWLDSKMRLQADPMLILEYFLWRRGSEYAISNHYDRHCVWEEVLQNKRLNKYNHTAIDEQFYFYQSDGLTKFNVSDPNTPLPSYVPEGSFIVRAHSPMSNLFSCLWFNEVDRFTSRDQLSFAYTFLKLRRMNHKKPFFLSMFKDCERRALAKLFRHRAVAVLPATAL